MIESESRSRDAVVRHALTEEERQRALEVLKALDALREQMRAEHGGEPYPSSVDLIRQMREERTEELMRRHQADATEDPQPLRERGSKSDSDGG